MLRILIISTLAAMAAAKVPSYLPVCGRRNIDLDGCVKNSIEALREKLREGMPELEAPSLEPLAIEEMKLVDESGFKVIAKNVKFYGLPDLRVQLLHVDLVKQEIDVGAIFNRSRMTADCDVTATVVFPLSGRGSIDTTTDDERAELKMRYNLVDYKGSKHMSFSSITTKLIFDDFTTSYVPLEGGASPLVDAINSALISNRQEIIKLIKPNLEEAISEVVLNFTNKIFKHITYDEALPDRE